MARIRIKAADVEHGAARGCVLMRQISQVLEARKKDGLATDDPTWTELKFHVSRVGDQNELGRANIQSATHHWDKTWIVYAEPGKGAYSPTATV